MGFPKPPRANLGAWGSGIPSSISAPSRTQTKTQAHSNAWSRPAPWANVRRTPAAPIVTPAPLPAPTPAPVAAPVVRKSEPIVFGLPLEVPTSPVEFIKVDRSPAKTPEQPESGGKPKKPAAVITSFKLPAPETPVERTSWTVTVEEVNWFEANDEVAVVASPEPPTPATSTESSPEPAESAWSTVAQRRGNPRWKRPGAERHSNRSSPRTRSSPRAPARRGYNQNHWTARQQQPQRPFRGQPKRTFNAKPVWRKVGSTDSADDRSSSSRRTHSRQVSPSPSSFSEQSWARADSGSSQTLSCESSPISSQPLEPCPPRRSDPQVQTVLDKMKRLGTASAAWADEDEEMDW